MLQYLFLPSQSTEFDLLFARPGQAAGCFFFQKLWQNVRLAGSPLESLVIFLFWLCQSLQIGVLKDSKMSLNIANARGLLRIPSVCQQPGDCASYSLWKGSTCCLRRSCSRHPPSCKWFKNPFTDRYIISLCSQKRD